MEKSKKAGGFVVRVIRVEVHVLLSAWMLWLKKGSHGAKNKAVKIRNIERQAQAGKKRL